MIECIDHVNLVVGDMQSMLAFYRDLLGLRLTKQATIRGPWIEAVTGLAQAEADVVFLEAPAGPRIELIRYQTPDRPRPALWAIRIPRACDTLPFVSPTSMCWLRP